MRKEIRLSELTLEDLHLDRFLNLYEVSFDMEQTVGDNIYTYLNSQSGFIQHKRHVNISKELEETYRQGFRNVVAKGSPIIIFIPSFSPKITNPSITNHQLLPNMSELLTLVHFHLIAKYIRTFYDYGFRFILGYKGYLHQPIFNWNEDTVQNTYLRLKELTKHAERITGTRNVIEWVDVLELAEKEGEYFQHQWQTEIASVRSLYQENNPYIVRKINGWIKDYSKSSLRDESISQKERDAHIMEEAIRLRAFKHIQYKGGEKGFGICNSLPPSVQPSVRGIDPSISLQINPYFRFHPHQRLILLNEQESKWQSFAWENEKKQVEPVWCEEFDEPFYYLST